MALQRKNPHCLVGQFTSNNGLNKFQINAIVSLSQSVFYTHIYIVFPKVMDYTNLGGCQRSGNNEKMELFFGLVHCVHNLGTTILGLQMNCFFNRLVRMTNRRFPKLHCALRPTVY